MEICTPLSYYLDAVSVHILSSKSKPGPYKRVKSNQIKSNVIYKAHLQTARRPTKVLNKKKKKEYQKQKIHTSTYEVDKLHNKVGKASKNKSKQRAKGD